MRHNRALFLTPIVLCLFYNVSGVANAGIITIGSFNGLNGYGPEAGVTIDSQGNIYGTTTLGGSNPNNNYGTVFKIAAGSNTITSLASFNGLNGYSPEAGVTLDAHGNLYGTTSEGGPGQNAYGTVFKIAAGTTTISTLASFNSTYPSGEGPLAGVTIDSQGNLYGTTNGGGAHVNGTVFEIAAGTTTLSTLASFNNQINGYAPYGGVTLDSQGNIYGTAQGGSGISPGVGDGIVYKIAAGTGLITTLASFAGPNGSEPVANLTFDSHGDIFGTTSLGGAYGLGTIFEIAAGTSALTTLVSFNGTNGSSPESSLTFDSQGNLYGTTFKGGAFGLGTVFEVAAGTSTLTTLDSFNITFDLEPNGAYPLGGVTLDSQGNLYGTTNEGGAYGDGTVFEILNPNGIATVPEPSSLVLCGIAGVAGLALAGVRRSRARARSNGSS
jgi:uncharacterized repeat protein (TIGR03803 family)